MNIFKDETRVTWGKNNWINSVGIGAYGLFASPTHFVAIMALPIALIVRGILSLIFGLLLFFGTRIFYIIGGLLGRLQVKT